MTPAGGDRTLQINFKTGGTGGHTLAAESPFEDNNNSPANHNHAGVMSRPVSKLSNFIMQIYNKIVPNEESRSPMVNQNGSPSIQI